MGHNQLLPGLVVSLCVNYFLAAVKAIWADVMPTVNLTSRWLNSQGGLGRVVVGATHVALRR